MTYVKHPAKMIDRARELVEDGLSQTAAGAVLGVDQQTVHRWIDPSFRAHHNRRCARNQRRIKRARRVVPGTRVPLDIGDRIVQLAALGMSYPDIAAVTAVYERKRVSAPVVKRVILILAPEYRGKPRGHAFGSPERRQRELKAAA